MAESAPLVSIGIPTFNRASSLARAVASALSQDYQNLEILISDNASSDSTEAFCMALSRTDRRIRYVRHHANRGLVANFHDVLSRARGEYFMWLSDDDWLDPGYVSQCARILAEHSDHVLACGKDRYFRGREFVFEGATLNLTQGSGSERVISYFRQVCHNGMFYGLMRRQLLSTLALQPVLGGDWMLMSSIAFAGKTRTLDTVSINRSSEGESENVSRLALRMGLLPKQASNPFLVIARSVARDIGWESPVYGALSKPFRFLLAIQAAWGIVSRYCLPRYTSPLKLLVRRIRTFARKARGRADAFLNRHVLWRFRSK